MGVRVRVGLSIGGKVIETVALVNSGFETDTPQVIVPRTMLSARDIGPELGRSVTMEYDTAGGPIAMLVYPRSCKVSVLEEDRKPKWIEADVVVSPVEREVVLSDALIEELGIIILSPKRGHWRFTDDPVDRVRSSYRPHYW